ncbi:uncharacterized protein G2W53_025107 [Senna tora]|uniref:Uncharacterized protein n=1 Tax=Senna tora TaxID=362788 RepID=A0A834WEG5_9FABA|nr:uncharacterized protein G2W53_025107 [Senna tora]
MAIRLKGSDYLVEQRSTSRRWCTQHDERDWRNEEVSAQAPQCRSPGTFLAVFYNPKLNLKI